MTRGANTLVSRCHSGRLAPATSHSLIADAIRRVGFGPSCQPEQAGLDQGVPEGREGDHLRSGLHPFRRADATDVLLGNEQVVHDERLGGRDGQGMHLAVARKKSEVPRGRMEGTPAGARRPVDLGRARDGEHDVVRDVAALVHVENARRVDGNPAREPRVLRVWRAGKGIHANRCLGPRHAPQACMMHAVIGRNAGDRHSSYTGGWQKSGSIGARHEPAAVTSRRMLRERRRP
jgi:hypothetical protein